MDKKTRKALCAEAYAQNVSKFWVFENNGFVDDDNLPQWLREDILITCKGVNYAVNSRTIVTGLFMRIDEKMRVHSVARVYLADDRETFINLATGRCAYKGFYSRKLIGDEKTIWILSGEKSEIGY